MLYNEVVLFLAVPLQSINIDYQEVTDVDIVYNIDAVWVLKATKCTPIVFVNMLKSELCLIFNMKFQNLGSFLEVS